MSSTTNGSFICPYPLAYASSDDTGYVLWAYEEGNCASPCPSVEFTTFEWNEYSKAILALCIISSVSSFFVLLLYLWQAEKFFNRIMFLLGFFVNSLVISIFLTKNVDDSITCNGRSRFVEKDSLCVFQAASMVFCLIWIETWSVIIAVDAYYNIVSYIRPEKRVFFYQRYTIIALVLSFTIALIPLIGDNYGFDPKANIPICLFLFSENSYYFSITLLAPFIILNVLCLAITIAGAFKIHNIFVMSRVFIQKHNKCIESPTLSVDSDVYDYSLSSTQQISKLNADERVHQQLRRSMIRGGAIVTTTNTNTTVSAEPDPHNKNSTSRSSNLVSVDQLDQASSHLTNEITRALQADLTKFANSQTNSVDHSNKVVNNNKRGYNNQSDSHYENSIDGDETENPLSNDHFVTFQNRDNLSECSDVYPSFYSNHSVKDLQQVSTLLSDANQMPHRNDEGNSLKYNFDTVSHSSGGSVPPIPINLITPDNSIRWDSSGRTATTTTTSFRDEGHFHVDNVSRNSANTKSFLFQRVSGSIYSQRRAVESPLIPPSNWKDLSSINALNDNTTFVEEGKFSVRSPTNNINTAPDSDLSDNYRSSKGSNTTFQSYMRITKSVIKYNGRSMIFVLCFCLSCYYILYCLIKYNYVKYDYYVNQAEDFERCLIEVSFSADEVYQTQDLIDQVAKRVCGEYPSERPEAKQVSRCLTLWTVSFQLFVHLDYSLLAMLQSLNII